jgi:hypothetical protein
MKRYALIGILNAALLAAVLVTPGASQNAAQAPDDKSFTLSVATEVVLVNVQVRDGKGTSRSPKMARLRNFFRWTSKTRMRSSGPGTFKP